MFHSGMGSQSVDFTEGLGESFKMTVVAQNSWEAIPAHLRRKLEVKKKLRGWQNVFDGVYNLKEERVDCFECRYFFIAWDKEFPRRCNALVLNPRKYPLLWFASLLGWGA